MTSSCGGLWYFHNAELLQVPYSGFASPNFQRWVPTLWCNTQENNICPEMWKTGRDVDWSNILMSTQFWKNFQNWRLLFIFTTLLIKNKAMRVRLTEAGCMDQNNRVVNCWVELWLVFSLHFICIWHKNIYRKCVSAVYRYLNQWDWHTDGTEHLCGLFKKKKFYHCQLLHPYLGLHDSLSQTHQSRGESEGEDSLDCLPVLHGAAYRETTPIQSPSHTYDKFTVSY